MIQDKYLMFLSCSEPWWSSVIMEVLPFQHSFSADWLARAIATLKRSSCGINAWLGRKPSPVQGDAQCLQVLFQELAVHMLGKQVGGVASARDLRQRELFQPQLLLHPQLCNRQMANVAKLAAPTNPLWPPLHQS